MKDAVREGEKKGMREGKAEDKDQNAKINLPTKTDDPKGWMGPVMAGGPSHGKFNLPSPTNSIYASIWRQERVAAPRDQTSPWPLRLFYICSSSQT